MESLGCELLMHKKHLPTQFQYELEIYAHGVRYKPVTAILSHGLVSVLLLGSLLEFNNIYVNVAHIIYPSIRSCVKTMSLVIFLQ